MPVTTAADVSVPRRRRRWPWVLGILAIILVLIVATISSFLQWTVKRSWPQTGGTIAVAAGAYFGVCGALRVAEAADFGALLKRRLGRT